MCNQLWAKFVCDPMCAIQYVLCTEQCNACDAKFAMQLLLYIAKCAMQHVHCNMFNATCSMQL